MIAAMATTRRADMFTADGKPSDDDPRGNGPTSAPQEAEGMARGVCADPPAASVSVKQRGAEVEDLLLGLVEVRDVEVQMELLRVRGIRPLRCPVGLHPLEREYETRSRVKLREVSTD
jgi:hypothetical protein